MHNLKSQISTIETLLDDGSEASLTYAALECRLAIERICYERLRLNHDLISHDDLRKWQPSAFVKTLIQDVEPWVAETFSLSFSADTPPEDVYDPTSDDFETMKYEPIGTQVGFNPNKLGKLWHGLANVALHIKVPAQKSDNVAHYGDSDAIASKVNEALVEIKRISEGTLLVGGTIGMVIRFECACGSTNKRTKAQLSDGQAVNCVNPECDESWNYSEKELGFIRRTIDFNCYECGTVHALAYNNLAKLSLYTRVYFNCKKCTKENYLVWKLEHQKKTLPDAP